MRLLADENIPKQVVDWLLDDGNDVVWARTHCPGATDSRLLQQAEAEAGILLTLDRDFWQLAQQHRGPLHQSGVVLFQVHPATPERLVPLAKAFAHPDVAWVGHVSVIREGGAIEMLAL